MKEKIKELKLDFDKARSEFIRLSGSIEGTLDTLISMVMDTSPEIAISLDRLVKTFHNLEGICSQGIISKLDLIVESAESIAEENEKMKSIESQKKLDEAVEYFRSKANKEKGANGK